MNHIQKLNNSSLLHKVEVHIFLGFLFAIAGVLMMYQNVFGQVAPHCYETNGIEVCHSISWESVFFDTPDNEVVYNLQNAKIGNGQYYNLFHAAPYNKTLYYPGDSVRYGITTNAYTMSSDRRLVVHHTTTDPVSAFYSENTVSPYTGYSGAGNPMFVAGESGDPYKYVFVLVVLDDDRDRQEGENDYRHYLAQLRTSNYTSYEILTENNIWKVFNESTCQTSPDYCRPAIIKDANGNNIRSNRSDSPTATQGLIGSMALVNGTYYYFYADYESSSPNAQYHLYYRTASDLLSNNKWSAPTRVTTTGITDSAGNPATIIIRVTKAKNMDRWVVMHNCADTRNAQDVCIQYTKNMNVVGTGGISSLNIQAKSIGKNLNLKGSEDHSYNTGYYIDYSQIFWMTDLNGNVAIPYSDNGASSAGELYWSNFVVPTGNPNVPPSNKVYGAKVWRASWTASVHNAKPTGNVEVKNSTKELYGYAFDPDHPNTPIGVHFYKDGAGVGPLMGAVTTQANGSYVFSIPTQYHTGNDHLIFAYGIDFTGGPNSELTPAPITFNSSAADNGVDLTAGPVTFSTQNINQGSDVLLTVSIINLGNQAATYFTNKFQLANQHNPGPTTPATTLPMDAAADTVWNLAGGASIQKTKTHSFQTSGNYSVRVCADDNGISGNVTETNENNNCGPWTNITVGTATCSAPLTRTVEVTCDPNSNGVQATSGKVTRSQNKSAYPSCTFAEPVNGDNSTYVSDTCAYPTYTVTPSAGANGTISPSTNQTVDSSSNNRTRIFTVTPSPGYYTTMGGTCPTGTLNGTTYTTGVITSNCTVAASFTQNTCSTPLTRTIEVTCDPNANGVPATSGKVTRSQNKSAYPSCTFAEPVNGDNSTYVSDTCAYPTYTVTPSAGANGTISPSTNQTVDSSSNNRTRIFTVTPSPGYYTTMGGTCPTGTLNGTTYTTGVITSNCTVAASFTQNTCSTPLTRTIEVTCDPNSNGVQATSGKVTRSQNKSAYPSCTFAEPVNGDNSTYVSDTCAYPTYTVTPSAGANGTISPSTNQTVDSSSNNRTRIFTVTPSPGYYTTMGGTCPTGTLNGTTYTTGVITSNCTVAASFTQNTCSTPLTRTIEVTCDPNSNGVQATSGKVTRSQNKSAYPSCTFAEPVNGDNSTYVSDTCAYPPATYTVTPNSGSNGFISPNTTQTVNSGSTKVFTVSPSSGYVIDTVTGCGGDLDDNKYTTGPISGNCTVSATFKASACDNGATNPPTCNTCPAGSVIVNARCTPVVVNVTANPTTYNTAPGSTVSFIYSPSTNSGAGTECRLLDNTQTALTSYVASTFISHTIPNSASSFGYYVQCRDKVTTSATDVSSLITVTSACDNGKDFVSGQCRSRSTITASQSPNGTISPAGSTSVVYGSDQTYTITPATGYNIASLVIDGVTRTANSSYTFSNVTADHTISANYVGFYSFFQVATDPSNSATIVDLEPIPVSLISGSGSSGISSSKVFSTPGDYYVRACADKSSSSNPGSIEEANENNNCSSEWTKLVISCPINTSWNGSSCGFGSGTCTNGATNYPACTINPGGGCINGGTNPPACTTNPGGGCINGGTNPPACTTAGVCSNGAGNYPACTTLGGACINGANNPAACTSGIGSGYSVVVDPKPIGGHIRSEDGNIDCGPKANKCVHRYTTGTNVVLKAIPISTFWKFIGWSGGHCSGENSCNLKIDSIKTVIGSFGARGFQYEEF